MFASNTGFLSYSKAQSKLYTADTIHYSKLSHGYNFRKSFSNHSLMMIRGGGGGGMESNELITNSSSYYETNQPNDNNNSSNRDQHKSVPSTSPSKEEVGNLYEEEVFFQHVDHPPPKPFLEFPSSSASSSSSSTLTSKHKPKVGLILMDNFSPYHGQYLSHMARNSYKVGVVSVLSGYMSQHLYDTKLKKKKDGKDNDTSVEEEEEEEEEIDHVSMRIPNVGEEKEWGKQIPFKVAGIICESDSGLPSAERLGVALGLYPERHDGINRARRDKFLMNEAMRKHGLQTVQQKLCSSVDEALDFASSVCNIPSVENEDDNNVDSNFKPRVVVKPTRGVASDNVHLCTNLSEVEYAYKQIYQTSIFGSPFEKHPHVLLQEFARGTEYAIDIVSKNGHHKVAALWKYDKRSVNGAPFVYHATILEDAHLSEEGMEACKYAQKALDALDLKWGLSHVEVMVNLDEKKTCLIEVNCRQHNTDFAPMTTVCIGYNALDMLLSAYLGDYVANDMDFTEEDDDAIIRLDWDLLPDFPSTRVLGAVIHLVCHVEGTVEQIQGLEELENLESVQKYEIYDSFSVGSKVSKTIDIRTDAGSVHLLHNDEKQFWMDYNRIMEIMKDMFIVEE